MPTSVESTLPILEERTGAVVPVYFSEGADVELGTKLLRDTVFGLVRELKQPRHICLAVDGSETAKNAILQMAQEFGVTAISQPKNFGKLNAVRHGMETLLEDQSLDLDYLAVIDADGDHFANALLDFIRAAEHVRTVTATEKVLVLGNRLSRHRPMGFGRGELEELGDRILLDALVYDAAVTGIPLRLLFSNTLDEFPDFHSGYKVFSRASAEDVFLAEPILAGCEPIPYYRHSVEAVMVVEAIKAGAVLSTVSRRTYDEQAITEFGKLDRVELIADLIIWPCRRLRIPPDFVAAWMANHVQRLQLATLVPEGREELLAIRERVFEAIGIELEVEVDPFARNLFV